MGTSTTLKSTETLSLLCSSTFSRLGNTEKIFSLNPLKLLALVSTKVVTSSQTLLKVRPTIKLPLMVLGIYRVAGALSIALMIALPSDASIECFAPSLPIISPAFSLSSFSYHLALKVTSPYTL